jgi:hypothetical protein
VDGHVVFSDVVRGDLRSARTTSLNIFLLGILIFKGLTARRLYKSFGVNGFNLQHLSSSTDAKVQTANNTGQQISKHVFLSEMNMLLIYLFESIKIKITWL